MPPSSPLADAEKPETPGLGKSEESHLLPQQDPYLDSNPLGRKVAQYVLGFTLVLSIGGFFVLGGPEQMSLSWDLWKYSVEGADGKTFARLLHLKNGDSMNRVNQLLGHVTINRDVTGSFQIAAERDPARYPDGVRVDDFFLEFCCVQPGSLFFQMRDGKLINFHPDHYRDLLSYK
ncbi:MAG: hypothetical protein C0478_13490 [Planctomyces sp.]|nr:hypothetical protein [Planctomyces sp.]